MKRILIITLVLFQFLRCIADSPEFEVVAILGVENPMEIAISLDGLKMIIVDQPKKGNKLVKLSNRPYMKSAWGAAIPIDPINKLILEDTRIEGPCVTFDNNYLLFAANFSDSKGGMDIYRCKLGATSVSEIENLGVPINTQQNENFPSISGNNRTIFFTREIEMKKLEKFATGELWMSTIDGLSDKWNAPQKINTEINSGGIAYPKLLEDNSTLFFSKITDDKSKWEINWAKRLDNIHWYVPVSIDTLNTTDCEISPVFCKQEQHLYFVTMDIGGLHNKGVIHKYPIKSNFFPDKTIELSGTITNQLTGDPLVANVLVTDMELGRIIFFTASDSTTGRWKALLNARSAYMLHVWNDRSSHVYKSFSSTQTAENQVCDIKLFPEVELTLNMYDKEELWPLDGTIVVKDFSGNAFVVQEKRSFKGQKILTLPIGNSYSISVSAKDYESDQIDLALNNVVLFDDLVRDIELVPIKRQLEIIVTDEETTLPLAAKIELIDLKGRIFIPESIEGNDGLYHIKLREGEQFDVEVYGPKGYAFKHTQIDLDADRELKQLIVQLKPLKRKVPIRLNNINFESNSADLLKDSHEELNRVVQLINDNPDIRMEIMAHTDDVGSDKYNLVLAGKRAKSVVEYLVVNGVAQNRLVSTGYGESMPLVPNTSDENKAINRRVEMKILDREEPILIEVDN